MWPSVSHPGGLGSALNFEVVLFPYVSGDLRRKSAWKVVALEGSLLKSEHICLLIPSDLC